MKQLRTTLDGLVELRNDRTQELSRRRRYTVERFSCDGHVLLATMAAANLYAPIREEALAYFKKHDIAWWLKPITERPEAIIAGT